MGTASGCGHINRHKNNRIENVQSINILRMKFYIFVIRKSNINCFRVMYKFLKLNILIIMPFME